MASIFGLVLVIFLFPAASATGDHASRTIEVNHNGRSHRAGGPSESAEEACAIDFGCVDDACGPCCGQVATIDSTVLVALWHDANGNPNLARRCPEAKPRCTGYKYGEKFGVCGVDAADASAASAADTSAGQQSRDDPALATQGCDPTNVKSAFPQHAKSMEYQMINDCPGALAVGTSCTPACKTGLVAFGAILCAAQGAASSTAECKPACTLTPPTNGGLGNCPNSMQIQPDTSCQYSCEPQYHPTGKTECFAGATSVYRDDTTVAAHENEKRKTAHVNRGATEAPLLQEAQCVLDPLISQALGQDESDIKFKRVSDMSVQAGGQDMNKVWASGGDVFTFLGSFDTECYYVLPKSADGATPATEVQMTIKVARPVTVNVCLLDGDDQRQAGFMRWPDTPEDGGSSETGWWRDQKAHGPIIDSSGTDHGGGMVFRKNFNEEEIKLPGNDYALNYLVFVCPQDNSHCNAAAVGDVFPMYAQAPNMNRNGGCDGELIIGASCSPLCHEGYVATGSITCTNSGLKSTARCISESEVTEKCSISVPQAGKFKCASSEIVEDQLKEDIKADPTKGTTNKFDAHPDRECHKNTATCQHDGQLEVGETCVPACDAGYSVSGEFDCYIADGGALATTLASCQASSSLLEMSNKKLMRTAAAPKLKP